MLLLGIGTPQAVIAALVYLLAHACYKGALFLVAGAVEHETGTRDVTALAGLRRAMPRTALAACSPPRSMAGVPLFVGFIAKEQFYESVGSFSLLGLWPESPSQPRLLASIFLGAAGLIAGVSPFAGPAAAAGDTPRGAGVAVVGSARARRSRTRSRCAPDDRRRRLSVWRRPRSCGTRCRCSLDDLAWADRNIAAQRRRRWPAPSACSSTASGCAASSGIGSLGTERLYTLVAGRSRRDQPMGRACAPKCLAAVIRADCCPDGRCVRRDRACDRRPSADVEHAGHRSNLYEGMFAVLIVAAALLAAFARSNMIAALSLGAVGYGVALDLRVVWSA